MMFIMSFVMMVRIFKNFIFDVSCKLCFSHQERLSLSQKFTAWFMCRIQCSFKCEKFNLSFKIHTAGHILYGCSIDDNDGINNIVD